MKNKIITVVLVLVVLISLFLGYICGRILPLGLGGAFLIFPGVLAISIYYYYISKKRKKIHFLSFSALLFILAVVIGFIVDLIDIKKSEEYLINADAIVLKYKTENNIQILSEEDFNKINLPEGVNFSVSDDGYYLYYKTRILRGGTNAVWDRAY